MIVRPLGQLVGWVAWVFLAYTAEVVRLIPQVPRASVPVQTEGRMVWAYYTLLGGLTWWLVRPREQRQGYLDGLRSTLWVGRAILHSSESPPVSRAPLRIHETLDLAQPARPSSRVAPWCACTTQNVGNPRSCHCEKRSDEAISALASRSIPKPWGFPLAVITALPALVRTWPRNSGPPAAQR
jgi:hypothetical protein